MNDNPIQKLRHDVLRIAADLDACKGMPSLYLSDWRLPKTTTQKVARKIMQAANKAHEKCELIASKLRDAVDESKSGLIHCGEDVFDWIPIKDGERIPEDIFIVVLKSENKLQIAKKCFPEWYPIIGWTHYHPLRNLL